jgi:hypothetical protein
MTERTVALALLLASGGYITYALQYPLGTNARPGPGFFPVAIGVFAAIVALGWVSLTMRRSVSMANPVAAVEGGVSRVTATSTLLLVFCVLLPWAGYPAVAFLFVASMLRRLGMGWRPALAIGVGSAAASYYLFGVLLAVPLPRGLWFD